MGKQPSKTTPEFLWARVRPGWYTCSVDGIDYTIKCKRPHRWELTGTVGPNRVNVTSTIGDSYYTLRSHARRSHAAHLARLADHAPRHAPNVGAVITDAVLCALGLRRAALELTDEGNGWYARYTVQPAGKNVVRLASFKPTADEAMRHLDNQIRAAIDVGGELHAEIAERIR